MDARKKLAPLNVPHARAGFSVKMTPVQDALFVGNVVGGGDAAGQGGALYVQPTCSGGSYCKTASATVADTSFVDNHAGQVCNTLSHGSHLHARAR